MTPPVTVLAVDDTTETLELIRTVLSLAGFVVRPADSGELALAALATTAPDLILLDLRMPGIDGLEVCRRVKADPKTRGIPVILMSAFAETHEWVEGLQLGAADYLLKPFRPEELVHRVRTQFNLLRARSQHQQLSELQSANVDLATDLRITRQSRDELQESLDRAERLRLAMLSVLEDQRQAEAALRESESFRQRLFESSAVPIVVMDPEPCRFLDCNPAAAAIFGLATPADVIGKTPADVSAPTQYDGTPSPAKARHHIEHALAEGKVFFEWRHQRPTGELWDAEVNLMSFEAGGRRLLQFTLQEITKRKQALEALHRTQERLELAQRAAGAGSWDWDIPTGHLEWSPELFAMFGLDPARDPATLAAWEHILHPDDRAAAAHRLEMAIRDATLLESDYRIVRPDGTERWIYATGRTSYDSAGRPLRMAGLCLDTTNRKAAEQALQHSEALFRSTFDEAPVGAAIVGLDQTFQRVNAALCRFLGHPAEELLRRTFTQITHPADVPDSILNVRRLLGGEVAAFEIEKRYLRATGEVTWGRVSVSLVRDREGRPLHFLPIIQDITARKRAESATEEAERFIRSTIDALDVHLCVLDENGVILTTNQAWDRFSAANGGTPELTGIGANYLHACDRAVGPTAEGAARIAAGIRSVLAGTAATFAFEYPCDGPDVHRWFTCRVTAFTTSRALRVVVAHENITERERAERALKESEQRYATTLAAVNDGLWEWNVADGTAYLSPLYYSMLGYTDGAFPATYADWRALIHPEDLERVEGDLRRSIASGVGFSVDLRMKTPAGEWRWVCTRGNTIERDARGHAQRMVGTLSDITQRKQAERDLERFFSLVPDMVCIASDDGRFLKLNDAWSRVLGYTKEELMAVPYHAFIHPEDLAATSRASVAQRAGNPATNFINRYRAKDGSYHWLEWNATPLKQGEVLFAAARDITEHRLAEEERRRSHEFLAKLAAQVPGVVYQYRLFPDGRSCFPYSSPGMRTIYEYAPEDVREDATPVFGRLHPEDIGFITAAIFESARTLAPFHCEFRVVLPRQGLRWRLSDAMPERTPDGGTLWYGIISDITERRLAEQALRTSLHEKEALLKEVHHRVKNNLQIISSLLRLQSEQTDHPAATGALHNMQGRIRSMALLHETLYRSGDLARVNLADYLEAVCTQLLRAHQRTAGAIDLRLELAPVELDATQAVPCGLLVNELVSNALKHAFPAGRAGLVHVELQVLPAGPAPGSAPGRPSSSSAAAGVKLRLAVTDNGVGLPAGLDVKDLRSLGLQLVSDLARQLQGSLTFGPGAEGGAAFALEFVPQVASPPPAPPSPSP